ncbi:MAG: hypothetical protein ABSA54_15285 [Terriglobales bacterium]
MAKKKRIWISETQTTRSGRKTLDELKQAVQDVLRSYVKLREAHGTFQTLMDELDVAAFHATIPHRYLTGTRKRV